MIKNLFRISTLALIFICLCSCGKKNDEVAVNEETEESVTAVRIEKIERNGIQEYIRTNGNVRADKSVEVFSNMAGKIVSSPMHLGNTVKKGDVIAYVDPSVPGSNYTLCEVKAPISGSLLTIPLRTGTSITTVSQVATIGDLSTLHIITFVPERYVGYLKSGLKADISVQAYPGKKIQAVVSDVSPVIDEDTRTKEVVLDIESSEIEICAGMFADITLYINTFEDVVSVPTDCIVKRGSKDYIYTIDGENRAHFISVNPVRVVNNRTIIEEFISNDSSVVIQGYETLHEGSLVNVLNTVL